MVVKMNLKKGDIIFNIEFNVKAEFISEEIKRDLSYYLSSFSINPLYRYWYPKKTFQIKVIQSFNFDFIKDITYTITDDLTGWFKIEGLEQVKKKQSHLPSWW